METGTAQIAIVSDTLKKRPFRATGYAFPSYAATCCVTSLIMKQLVSQIPGGHNLSLEGEDLVRHMELEMLRCTL